mgnify:CR=1 FL=1
MLRTAIDAQRGSCSQPKLRSFLKAEIDSHYAHYAAVGRSAADALDHYEFVAVHIEPRVKKRRLKQYPLMNQPRDTLRKDMQSS